MNTEGITNILMTAMGALISYLVLVTLITYIITGTGTGDLLIQNIAPIVAAACVLILIVTGFLGKKSST